jgi:hypothetical protein
VSRTGKLTSVAISWSYAVLGWKRLISCHLGLAFQSLVSTTDCGRIADFEIEILIAKYAKKCIQADNCCTFEYVYSDEADGERRATVVSPESGELITKYV